MAWTASDDRVKEAGVPAPRSVSTQAAVTVLVPTRNEAGNVAPLLDRLALSLAGSDAEVLFVDDSSDDTPAVVRREAERHPGLRVRLLHRGPGERHGGLGGAVLAGVRATSSPWLVVMDADLQHPPETLPDLLAATEDVDLVVASRHVATGSSEGLAGPARVLVSGSATALAKLLFPRRLAATTDPMSGFFAFRRDAVDVAALRPDGFKVLLEVLVRSRHLRVREVPFRFADRHSGDSKASWREGLRYLRALLRLRASASRALAFAAVGASGIAVNLGAMAVGLGLGLHYLWAAAAATQASSTWNALLTEHLVFADRVGRAGRVGRVARSVLLNNVVLLLRLPLLAVLVDGVGLPALVAALLSLLVVFLGRFSVTDQLIYRTSDRMEAS